MRILAALLFLTYVSSLHNDPYDVLVLGGGFSGIGAARYLHDNGIDRFLVLEAKNHLGGRVKSAAFGGKRVSLGASWIHDVSDEHVVWKLAEKYNLTVQKDSQHFRDTAFRNVESGDLFGTKHVANVGSKLLSKICMMENMIINGKNGGRDDVSLRTAMRLVGWESGNDILKRAMEFTMFDFQHGVESDVFSAGVYSQNHIADCHNKNEYEAPYIVTDARGYEYLIEQEAKPFQNKIRLNQEVKSVERRPDGIYRVTVSNWERYYAKHVLLTFSTGVLLSDEVVFKPPLPAWKQQSLAMVPMGHYCKVFMRFRKAFWDMKGYIMLASKFQGQFMHYQNYKLPGLFPDTNILLLTLTGDVCHDFQKRTDTEVRREIMKTLRKVYPKTSFPIDILRTNWSGDKHFKGAYSYPVTGIMPEDYKALRHPVEKSLWFTGEYIHMKSGKAHSAYQNGIETAQDILKCIKGECPDTLPIKTKL